MKKILDLSALVVVAAFLSVGCLSGDQYTIALPGHVTFGTDEPPTVEPPDEPPPIEPPPLVEIPSLVVVVPPPPVEPPDEPPTDEPTDEPPPAVVIPRPVVVPPTIIPPEIRETFEKDMPIYSGDTPPDISGQYLADHFTLVASSLSYDRIGGTSWADLYVAFIKGSNGKISYKSRNGTTGQSTSDDVVIEIVGSDDNFTAYFVESGTSYGINVKQSTVISGTLTNSGISNFQYAFVMLEKGPDPSGVLVSVNTYRVFKDGDGLASKYNWLSKKVQSPDSDALSEMTRHGLLERLDNSQRESNN